MLRHYQQHFPKLFTALRLLAGCLAITLIFNQHFETATYVLVIACGLDLIDTFLDRFLIQFPSSLPSLQSRDVRVLADMGQYYIYDVGFLCVEFSVFQEIISLSHTLSHSLTLSHIYITHIVDI